MAKFDVYESRISMPPYVCQIQSTFLDHLATRLVVPIYRSATLPNEYERNLTPKVVIKDEDCQIVTQEMFSLPKNALGKKIGNIKEHDFNITRAVDFLMQGF